MSDAVPDAGTLESFVDEILYFRGSLHVSGWVYHTTQAIREIGWQLTCQPYRLAPFAAYGRDSGDVLAERGERARNCRFRLVIPTGGGPEPIPEGRLVFTLDDGRRIESATLQNSAVLRFNHDPYHLLQRRFFALIHERPAGRVLEIGSRSRSGNIRRQNFPPGTDYVGMDILPGENVDVVGDAHALGRLCEPESFDFVLSMSVFEHLLMPWKVVLEMNKVMKPGGLVLITTHQSLPLHELPWDFLRFSDQAWHGFFNRFTGFEIIATALGEPASVVPHLFHRVLAGVDNGPAYIGSAVLARKVGPTSLEWDVDINSVISTMYPSESV